MSKITERGEEYEVLTVREVAVMLKVHIYTVHDLLRTGRLTGFKLNRRWRIRRSAIMQFMSADPVTNERK